MKFAYLFPVVDLSYAFEVSALSFQLQFKSVSKIMNASIDELIQVEGIGKLSAEKIREVLDTELL
jgi:ERCC4-type nuclease